jgi:hypothetical protein
MVVSDIILYYDYTILYFVFTKNTLAIKKIITVVYVKFGEYLY